MKIRIALSALSFLALAPARAAPELDPGHILGDLCATPDPAAFPSTHVYRLANGGTIVFVAVAHVGDAKSPARKAEILKSISDAFDRYKPDMVLIEGASSRKSADSQYIAFLADTARRAFSTGNIEENLFSVKLASDRGVTFSGWDIAPHEEYIDDIADGFDVPDAIGAHLLRARQNPFATPSSSVIQREVSAVPTVRRPDHFDFTGWYRKTYSDTFDPRAGTPCGTGIASRIVKDESIRRTLNLMTLLDSYAQPGKVVMVEAGGGHWLALQHHLTSISKPGR